MQKNSFMVHLTIQKKNWWFIEIVKLNKMQKRIFPYIHLSYAIDTIILKGHINKKKDCDCETVKRITKSLILRYDLFIDDERRVDS